MKKKFLFFLVIISTLLSFGCNKTKTIITKNDSIKEEQINEEKQKIDIDISSLSDTLVYAQIQQMFWHPEEYYEKMVRIKGTVDIFTDKNTNKTYYTCLVNDATACCSLGIEFRLKNNQPLPKKIKQGDTVIVQGIFSSYNEGEKKYLELKNSVLE